MGSDFIPDYTCLLVLFGAPAVMVVGVSNTEYTDDH